jgi:hypothetical protein
VKESEVLKIEESELLCTDCRALLVKALLFPRYEPLYDKAIARCFKVQGEKHFYIYT